MSAVRCQLLPSVKVSPNGFTLDGSIENRQAYFVPPFFFSSSGFISSGSCAFNASSLGRSL